MRNAKEELLLALKNTNSEVKCIKIEFGYYGDKKVWVLPLGYTEEDIGDFLNNLDFEYDSGYGGQLLYGNVWFTDGTWLERGEYDGSEWWEYKTTPAIPEECRTINGKVDNTLLLN